MNFTTHFTTSQDGTRIGYRQTGSGEGLIICHGGGRISQSYEKLACALADSFTVYIPDRRGRGLSGVEGENYTLQKAVEDLDAVIKTTSTEFIFGHSAGALIALETSLKNPIKKLAVYEPPISVNYSFPLYWLTQFEEALQKNKRKKALAISLKGLNVIDGLGKMPLWAIELLINVLSLFERKQPHGTRMLDLIPTLLADVKMVKTLEEKMEQYQKIEIPVYLMAGAKSPDYFHIGLQALAKNINHSAITVLKNHNHYSPEENVTEITRHLKSFFKTAYLS